MREFSQNHMILILQGLGWTVALTLAAMIFGGILGLLVAVLRSSPNRWVSLPSAVLIRLFQGIPLVVVIFMIYFGIARTGYNVSPFVACAVGLSLFAAAFLGEIWRGALLAIPRAQWESADSLGMTSFQMLRIAILPQALRLSAPATVGFLVQLVKATSVCSMVGFVELMRAGQMVNGTTFDSFRVFGIVAALYLLINLPMSFAAKRLEKLKL